VLAMAGAVAAPSLAAVDGKQPVPAEDEGPGPLTGAAA
jgi:hypothetical protein